MCLYTLSNYITDAGPYHCELFGREIFITYSEMRQRTKVMCFPSFGTENQVFQILIRSL